MKSRSKQPTTFIGALCAIIIVYIATYQGRAGLAAVYWWSPVVSEILHVMSLLLCARLMDRRADFRVWFPGVGGLFVLGGLLLRHFGVDCGHFLILVGIGPVIAVRVQLLWTDTPRVRFFFTYAVCNALATLGLLLFVMPPNVQPYTSLLQIPLLAVALCGLSGVEAGADVDAKAHRPTESGWSGYRLYLLMGCLLLVPLILNFVVYKAYNPTNNFFTLITTVMNISGMLLPGWVADRKPLKWTLLFTLAAALMTGMFSLALRMDILFTHALSYFGFAAVQFSLFTLPLLLWNNTKSIFRTVLGRGICMLWISVIPRLIDIWMPTGFLFSTAGGMAEAFSFLLLIGAGGLIALHIFRPQPERIVVTETVTETVEVVREVRVPVVIRQEDHPPPLPDTLTAREFEVAKLILQGKAIKDIVAELNVKENTVKFHLKNIFQKTDCRSQTLLLAIYGKRPE